MIKRLYYFIIFTFLLSLTSAVRAEDSENRPWLAVHDFTVTPKLAEKGINGWRIAEKFENEMVQQGRYRIVTRAKIAKVLKEKNISSSGTMEPSKFAKMVGAEFIITGQVDMQGERIVMIAKLIDTARETGEIEKSFDASNFIADDKDILRALSTLTEELAHKMAMTPGEFLDYGISMMQHGNYVEAVEAFQELKRIGDVDKIKAFVDKYDNLEAPIPGELATPGELYDYGLKMMNAGKKAEAASAFRKLKKITPLKEIGNLLMVGEVLRKARKKADQQRSIIKNKIDAAARLFIQARQNQAKAESPEELCDKSMATLEALLVDPKSYLTQRDKRDIEGLIAKIKIYRASLFSGPVSGKNWIVPELDMKFVPVKAGSFKMGNPQAFEGDDDPVHKVTISKPFWIGKYEVTIDQFLYYLQHPNNSSKEPSRVQKDLTINWEADWCPINKAYRSKRGRGITWGKGNQPMIGVTWRGAEMFCQWLTEREQKAKRLPKDYEYRLPTEAEWEYCCRAGSEGKYCSGDSKDDLHEYGWYRENSKDKTHPAGEKKPNKWKICDMHGNVWEWCYDWYDGPYLVSEEMTDPTGSDASEDNLKILRGGSFSSSVSDLKSSVRYSFDYRSSKKNAGFRVVCGPRL